MAAADAMRASFAQKRRGRWATAAIVAELGGESAVLNRNLEQEISRAQQHYAAIQSGGNEGPIQDYADQGDMSMYTKENLIKRNRLKSHPGMVDGIAEFWEMLDPLKTPQPEVRRALSCRCLGSRTRP